MASIANLLNVTAILASGASIHVPFSAAATRRHVAGLIEIATLNSAGVIVGIADSAIYPRNLRTSFFDTTGGGNTDPVGPQRWPLKL